MDARDLGPADHRRSHMRILAALSLVLALVPGRGEPPAHGAAAPGLVPIAAQGSSSGDPLPSWNDGPSKKAIRDFVGRVTSEGGLDFVALSDRIATFDNDGTLWAEQPIYVQFAFALDRVKALAPRHPDWKERQPFKGILEGDLNALAASGERGIVDMMMATHADMTTDEFASIVTDWIVSARHPKTNKLYTDMVYQPMLELLAYLRANGFKTFVVSGGGVEFMRPWAERVYGIPPEQLVGSRIKVKLDARNGRPVLLRLPEADLIDDKAGKVVGIHEVIGRRPIAAFGNSDGDFEMLEWVTSGPGARLGMIVHHTDDAREWAYDRTSHVGQLTRALDEAPKRGWIVVDMKQEWKEIYRSGAR